MSDPNGAVELSMHGRRLRTIVRALGSLFSVDFLLLLLWLLEAKECPSVVCDKSSFTFDL